MLSDFGLLLMTVFSGVFSMAIGFVIFVLIALLLALPYFLIQRREDMEREENAASGRY
jgi:preprotein translocase subunit YajC